MVPPFPLETLRHWYVTPFGGHSRELSFYQVGIRRDAIEANTELDPRVDRVRIGLLGQRNVRPYLIDHAFQIVPLDARRPAALAHPPRGAPVLPLPAHLLRRPSPAAHPPATAPLTAAAPK